MNGMFVVYYRVPLSRSKVSSCVFKNQGTLEVVFIASDCLPCVLWKAFRRDIKTLTSDRY